jgi:hypothetical protein
VKTPFANPFRPGAGHMPPYLAGRKHEEAAFKRLLQQATIFENLILTGLRGVGKTVLLDTFKPLALQEGWLWAGTDLSESSSVNESTLCTRMLADLAPISSSIIVAKHRQLELGFASAEIERSHTLGYPRLIQVFEQQPGLAADKLKSVFRVVWSYLERSQCRGIIFAYDEAQNLSDHAIKDQYPLSLLLDVFQSMQKAGIPFMLVLTGLPTLFTRLVEARTYSERMFHVLFLDRLSGEDSKAAIRRPIEAAGCPVKFTDRAVEMIGKYAGGYPYFIQFICREAYDSWLSQATAGEEPQVPLDDIISKLDNDFFAGRWNRLTDRQRELLQVVASLQTPESEFTVQEVVKESRAAIRKSFSSSHANQMLASLSNMGMVYKNRHGRYALAVPLLAQFIRRQKAGVPKLS